jgi:acyl-CoA hydrolase
MNSSLYEKNIYIVEQLNKDNANERRKKKVLSQFFWMVKWNEEKKKGKKCPRENHKLKNLKSSFRSIHEVKNGKTFHK